MCVCVMSEFQTNLNAKPKMMNQECQYLTCALRNSINLPPLSRPETTLTCGCFLTPAATLTWQGKASSVRKLVLLTSSLSRIFSFQIQIKNVPK